MEIQNYDSVVLVGLPEKLVMANSAEIRGDIQQLVEEGQKYLILDLSRVEFIDSSGLSILVSALKAVQPLDGEVLLLKPTDNVRALIELTRLHQVFDIYEDQPAAIFHLHGMTRKIHASA
ncbi:MAG: STAS domain-containing protein [Gammaproteobacteria bacterium]|nr:STAS domain-containing protein [Gammaproteobacteria bacterium]